MKRKNKNNELILASQVMVVFTVITATLFFSLSSAHHNSTQCKNQKTASGALQSN